MKKALAILLCLLLGSVSMAETYITTGKVYLREEATSRSASLMILHEGDLVEATGETAGSDGKGNWIQVQAFGQTGWVSAKYCEPYGETAPSDAQEDNEVVTDEGETPEAPQTEEAPAQYLYGNRWEMYVLDTGRDAEPKQERKRIHASTYGAFSGAGNDVAALAALQLDVTAGAGRYQVLAWMYANENTDGTGSYEAVVNRSDTLQSYAVDIMEVGADGSFGNGYTFYGVVFPQSQVMHILDDRAAFEKMIAESDTIDELFDSPLEDVEDVLGLLTHRSSLCMVIRREDGAAGIGTLENAYLCMAGVDMQGFNAAANAAGLDRDSLKMPRPVTEQQETAEDFENGELRAAIHAALRKLGYSDEDFDAAVDAFRSENGLAKGGATDAELLERLITTLTERIPEA